MIVFFPDPDNRLSCSFSDTGEWIACQCLQLNDRPGIAQFSQDFSGASSRPVIRILQAGDKCRYCARIPDPSECRDSGNPGLRIRVCEHGEKRQDSIGIPQPAQRMDTLPPDPGVRIR